MDFITHDHNFGLNIVSSNLQLKSLWEEIVDSIKSISDERILQEFRSGKQKMSISDALNKLIEEELTKRNWVPQSAIFQGKEYDSKKWRLDFSKRIETPDKGITGMAVEVAFNHGEAIAWNLLKPNLAAEINQVEVQTEIGSGIGIYICATKQLKKLEVLMVRLGSTKKFLDTWYHSRKN